MTIESLLDNDKVPFREFVNPGATDEDLDELADVFGAPIDEQFIKLYKAADGESFESPGLFFGLEWMPLQDVISEVEFNQEEEEEISVDVQPPGAIKEEYYYAHWLPFATDGSGNFLAIDMDPGETGKKGQVISYGSDLDTFYVVADSLNDFLGFIQKTIDSGNFNQEEDNRFNYGDDQVIFIDQLEDMDLPLKG
ncbi:SMI1/KNR4 family protein [Macrococcus lamae]|uniref:Knr4/Smi1-like domain-containing protein n=1 Tax=Macrococcus lamae TaxID=198484 RepID=A0A4R6BSA9_9STAP|nr:SMI1/KNR4 family protein [Macrococcus lamae]TDM05243.1 hypothetical protein ERX29_10340 [Macrococcus lamae]